MPRVVTGDPSLMVPLKLSLLRALASLKSRFFFLIFSLPCLTFDDENYIGSSLFWLPILITGIR